MLLECSPETVFLSSSVLTTAVLPCLHHFSGLLGMLIWLTKPVVIAAAATVK